MAPTLTPIDSKPCGDDTRPSVGRRVRGLRRNAKLTIGDVARLSDFDRSYIRHVEHDRIAPSLKFLQQLADLTGVSFGRIITGYTAKTRPARGGDPEQVGSVLASVLDNLAENKSHRAARRSDRAKTRAG